MIKWEEILKAGKDEIERGLKLHRKIIVYDSISCDPQLLSSNMINKVNEMLDAGKSTWEIRETTEKMRVRETVKDPDMRKLYAEKWRKSGVTCISMSLSGYQNYEVALERASEFIYLIDELKDIMVKATRAEDIRRAKREGKHCVIFYLQNTLPLGGGPTALEKLEFFYRLGVRIIQLTYNMRNFVGGGCLEPSDAGLSLLGSRLVERMNEMGVLVDVSHCGHQTTMDAVEASKEPIAATHTGCRSLYDSERSKTDEELRAIAEKHGYIGIYAVPGFIGPEGANITNWLDHVDYAVDLVGVDHVGLGSDQMYSYFPLNMPERYYDIQDKDFVSNWWMGFQPKHRGGEKHLQEMVTGTLAWENRPYFTAGLVARGYSDQEIEKIMGGNFLKITEKIIG